MLLAVTLNSIEDVHLYKNKYNVDAFIIGNEITANRLSKSFTSDEMKDIIKEVKSLGKQVIISMNLIVHNKDIEEVNKQLTLCKERNVDAIIYSDLAVYNLAKKQNMEHLLIYNPETLNTNTFDPVFWKNKGIKGITISKEITLKEIIEISQINDIQISIIGHGHLNMFHSRRPLIENFFKYNKESYDEYVNNRNLTLVEEIRNESYPVFQDNHGTHIFRDKSVMSFNEISKLEENIDLFIIDGIFKDTDYLLKVVKDYNEILQNPSKSKEITEQYLENHDSGFYYKKTVYDKY